jgi:hypothetical protein
VALFTRLASPEAELLTAGDEVALALGLGLGLAVVDAFGEEVAEALAVGLGLGVALAATSGTILAEVLAVLVAVGVGVGVALIPAGLVLGEGVALELADGLGLAEAAGELYGSNSSTWRNRRSAFALTSWMVCAEPLPGTVTISRLLPCACTWAPELPVPLTRDSMMVMAAAISDEDGVFPFGVLACMVTWVPLDRSSPRPTLKRCGHADGLNRLVPRIPSNIATTSTARTVSARPGCGTVLLGGATSPPVCDQSLLIPADAGDTLVLVGGGQVIVEGVAVFLR